MRPSALELLVVVVVAAAVLTTGRAAAQYGGYDRRGERGAQGYDARRSQDLRTHAPSYGDGRYGGPPSYARDGRNFGDTPYGGGGGRAWSRGQYLPPDYRGASVADPSRYHLRAPPAGYGWVGDGRNAYLMQRSTGLVLDLVPRAYERPSAARPRQ